MPYAKLEVTVPENIWISELSQDYPATRFRILAATADDERGVARLEIIGPVAGQVCEQIEQYETVTELSVFEQEANRRRVQVETTVPVLLNAIQTAGIPLDLPVEVDNGTLTLETTLSQKKLSTLGETLDNFGIKYTVERIQQETESESLLTERQEGLLREAIERGYYDTPRRITLVELAEEVGIAKSTCSEILHRAEGQVLKQFLGGDCEHQPDISITAD
ncbi:helix-turn-helix domain-containing protein [Halovenus halobia]|uniref:helix-turn-helix domain-containing protein n=1 Tax=Halovenus halobia TaxID=3396622 RepID=UPI003F56C451